MIIACVRTGTRYGLDYVTKLRDMCSRHMQREYGFYCLTDQPERCSGASFVDVRNLGLPGWWAKMMLFEPSWRGRHHVVYFDLDTLIIGNITPLADVPGEFAITESFTRLAGITTYPCRYNSSVMTIGAGQASFIWERFSKVSAHMMKKHEAYGDQAAIEELYPHAALLQRLMPKGFFCNYRDLTMHVPEATAVINFGGQHKPANCPIPWVQDKWR